MITSKQRAYLRSMANTLKPTHQIGKNGVTDSVIAELNEALEAHELIKITLLESAMMSSKECAAELAEGLGAEIVGVIGFKITIYRRASKDENVKIELPE